MIVSSSKPVVLRLLVVGGVFTPAGGDGVSSSSELISGIVENVDVNAATGRIVVGARLTAVGGMAEED